MVRDGAAQRERVANLAGRAERGALQPPRRRAVVVVATAPLHIALLFGAAVLAVVVAVRMRAMEEQTKEYMSKQKNKWSKQKK